MANQVRTDVIVRGKGEGFSQLRDDINRTNESVEKGAQKGGKTISETEKRATALAKQLDTATRGLEKMEGKVRRLEKALKDADRARGAFLQGMTQGLGIGEFVQRGPGMGRQVMGIQAGKALAAPSRLVGGAAFGGMGGFTSAMRELPFGLGMASVPLASAMGMARQGLGYQQSLLQAAPFLSSGGMPGAGLNQRRIRRAGERAAAGAELPAVQDAAVRANVHEALQSMAAQRSFASVPVDIPIGGVSSTGGRMTLRESRRQQHLAELQANPTVMGNLEDRARYELGVKSTKAVREEARIAGERQEKARQITARREAGQKGMVGGLAQIGLNYGAMDKQQTLQFAAQLRQVAGGAGAVGGGDVQGAIAAQTALGVGGDVSGAFMRAGRRGGVVGGGGMDAMYEAVGQGMKLGLEGSELVEHMQAMAQGIQQFRQTGIPINPTSIGEMGTVMTMAGMQGTRAAVVGGAMQRYGTQVAQRGPQGALDLMMLQQSGFEGGGIKDMFGAMQSLEKGMGGQQMADMVTKLAGMGGSAEGGALLIQRMMQQMGASVGLDEALGLSEAARGGKITPEKVKEIEAAQSKSPGSVKDTAANVAKNMVDVLAPGLKGNKEVTNKQIGVGQGMIGTMNKLEGTMVNVAASAKNLASKDIERLAGGIEVMSTALNNLTKAFGGEALSGNMLRVLESFQELRSE